jgi:hypothetical protein
MRSYQAAPDVDITSTNMFGTLTRMAIYQKKERTIVTRQETIFQV